MRRVEEHRKEIANIHGELRRLTRQYRQSVEEERPALEELRKSLWQCFKTLRRAENHRRKCRERMQRRAKFTSNSFQFVSKLLGKKTSARHQQPREEVEHLCQVLCQKELGEGKMFLDPEPPITPFDMAEPRLKGVRDTIKRASAVSAPGPDGIPYKVQMYMSIVLS